MKTNENSQAIEAGSKDENEPLSDCCGAPEIFPHSSLCSDCKCHSSFSIVEEE